MKRLFFFLLIPLLFISGCQNKTENKSAIAQTAVSPAQPVTRRILSGDSIWSNDPSFVIDSLFKGRHKELINFYFKKYNSDSCAVLSQSKKDMKEGFEGLQRIGDLNLDHKPDSVFVMNPIGYYCGSNDGESYYFTDTSLPRLETNSYCCHPNNVFIIGDIDEDGICEIGQWNSSCSSKYKGLFVWSLKNKQWKMVGSCGIMAGDFTKKAKRIQKLSKGKFRMLEALQLEKEKWIYFTI